MIHLEMNYMSFAILVLPNYLRRMTNLQTSSVVLCLTFVKGQLSLNLQLRETLRWISKISFENFISMTLNDLFIFQSYALQSYPILSSLACFIYLQLMSRRQLGSNFHNILLATFIQDLFLEETAYFALVRLGPY